MDRIAPRRAELQRDQLGSYQLAVAEYCDVVRLLVDPPGLRRALHLVTHPDGVDVLAGDPDGYSKNTPYYEEIAAYLGNGLLRLSRSPRCWRGSQLPLNLLRLPC